MLFGNASWGFRETPLEKQLEITSEMGLELLELGIANAPSDLPLDVTDSELSDVKELFGKYKIKLLCAATGNDFTTGNRDDVAKIKRVVDICEKLGIRYLRIFAGFTPVEEVVGEKWDIMTECLNEVYAYAKEKNVVPVVETHGGVNGFDDGVEHFYSTSSKPEALLKMIDEVPDIMINYDPANLYAVGIENPEEVYDKIKSKVCYVHLKDFVKLPGGHLLPAACGESDMNWKNILLQLKDFSGPALFEYENVGDVKEGCERCYEYIKKILKEIN